jgi:2-iminobutanoate/2-iminopropanoate deaminase
MARSILVPGLGHGSNPVPAAARCGPLLATGGVRGIDLATGSLPDDPRSEVRHAFANLGAILQAGGAHWADVLHVTVFLADGSVRELVNAEWVATFPDETARPARHVLVQPLPGGMTVQLEALAYVTESGRA